MDNFDAELASETSRRRFLRHAALGTAGLAAAPALAQQLVDVVGIIPCAQALPARERLEPDCISLPQLA